MRKSWIMFFSLYILLFATKMYKSDLHQRLQFHDDVLTAMNSELYATAPQKLSIPYFIPSVNQSMCTNNANHVKYLYKYRHEIAKYWKNYEHRYKDGMPILKLILTDVDTTEQKWNLCFAPFEISTYNDLTFINDGKVVTELPTASAAKDLKARLENPVTRETRVYEYTTP